ncbi:CTIF factor, partial [Polyodon spathula]|nr:CTIF factor [Polyodon spathula]
MENSSVASASSEAGSTRSQEIEELERFIDSYVLEYQVQGLLTDKTEAEADGEGDKTQCSVSQWNEDCRDRIDGSWSSSKGKGSSKPNNQVEWEHSSNDSTGSRPSSGSRPGSGSRSGSRGRNNQFRTTGKNGNKDDSFDILGTDIWAANTFESHGGATWDLQPEKLDFTQFHRKPIQGTPKHLPHIDREGMVKGKFEDDDGINLNDMEKFLPVLPSKSCSKTYLTANLGAPHSGVCLPVRNVTVRLKRAVNIQSPLTFGQEEAFPLPENNIGVNMPHLLPTPSSFHCHGNV